MSCLGEGSDSETFTDAPEVQYLYQLAGQWREPLILKINENNPLRKQIGRYDKHIYI